MKYFTSPIGLYLFDKEGILKTREGHQSEFEAYSSGKNWELLNSGNYYEIKYEYEAIYEK